MNEKMINGPRTEASLDADPAWEWIGDKWQIGYISRKSTPENRMAYYVDRGPYKGCYAVSVPAWNSSRYCKVRRYRLK